MPADPNEPLAARDDDDEPPPIAGTWKRLYTIVVVYALAVIAALYAMSVALTR